MRTAPPLRALLTLVLALAPLGLEAQTPPPAKVVRQVNAYTAQAKPGPASVVQNWRLPVGRMSFDIQSGTLVPLQVNGQTVGFHVSGKGAFTYRSEDNLERLTMSSNFRRNLDRTGSTVKLVETPGGATLTDTFTSFTLWYAGMTPSLPQGDAAELPKSLASDWAYFLREGLGDRGQDFAIHLANSPGKTLARAEIMGANDPFIYVLDQGSGQHECLWSVAKPYAQADYDGLRRVLLSDQPIGWNWKAPMPPLLNLTAVDINLQAEKSGATVKVVETLVAGDEGLTVIALDLYNLHSRYERKGPYVVRRVVDEQGRSLPFHHRNDRILVELPSAPAAGAPFTLTFEYGGRFLLHPGGDNYWELGVEPWFPQPDMAGQAYTVHALIQTPKDDVAISGGKTLRRMHTDAGNLLEVRIDKPVQFFTIFAGAYSITEEVKDGLTIRVAAYGNKGGGQQSKLINIARQTIGFYEDLFEKFPFDEFNIVQVNTFGYGQAPPGMMLITNEAFTGKIDEMSSFFTKGINQRFAHEIAHQYWGHLVKMGSPEEQWITESFANYASALAMRSMRNQGASAYEGLLSTWRNQASAYASHGSIPFANRLNWTSDPRGTFLARTSLLYEKGALILAALHKDMGDQAFSRFMKSLIANFRWQAANTVAIEKVASMAGHKDYSALFQDCYWGPKMPGR